MPAWVVSVVVPLVLGLMTLAGVFLLHRRERERSHLEASDRSQDRIRAKAEHTIETALTERGVEERVQLLDRRYDGLITRIDKVAEDLADFKEHAARDLLTRGEYVQSQSRFERKLDAIGEHILSLTRTVGSSQNKQS